MSNGTIQQRARSTVDLDDRVHVLRLRPVVVLEHRPRCRSSVRRSATRPTCSTPIPEDRYFRQFPGKFRAELHYRLTSPLLGASLRGAAAGLPRPGRIDPTAARRDDRDHAARHRRAVRRLSIRAERPAPRPARWRWLHVRCPARRRSPSASSWCSRASSRDRRRASWSLIDDDRRAGRGLFRRHPRGRGHRRDHPMISRTLSLYFAGASP